MRRVAVGLLVDHFHSGWKERGGWQVGQPNLVEWIKMGREDWILEQKVAAQPDLFGLSLEAYPLELMAEEIQVAGMITTVEADRRVGCQVTLAGLRYSGHRRITAKDESIMFLTRVDLSGMLDVVLFLDAHLLCGRLSKPPHFSLYPTSWGWARHGQSPYAIWRGR